MPKPGTGRIFPLQRAEDALIGHQALRWTIFIWICSGKKEYQQGFCGTPKAASFLVVRPGVIFSLLACQVLLFPQIDGLFLQPHCQMRAPFRRPVFFPRAGRQPAAGSLPPHRGANVEPPCQEAVHLQISTFASSFAGTEQRPTFSAPAGEKTPRPVLSGAATQLGHLQGFPARWRTKLCPHPMPTSLVFLQRLKQGSGFSAGQQHPAWRLGSRSPLWPGSAQPPSCAQNKRTLCCTRRSRRGRSAAQKEKGLESHLEGGGISSLHRRKDCRPSGPPSSRPAKSSLPPGDVTGAAMFPQRLQRRPAKFSC